MPVSRIEVEPSLPAARVLAKIFSRSAALWRGIVVPLEPAEAGGIADGIGRGRRRRGGDGGAIGGGRLRFDLAPGFDQGEAVAERAERLVGTGGGGERRQDGVAEGRECGTLGRGLGRLRGGAERQRQESESAEECGFVEASHIQARPQTR